jgi:hypothetical protein
MPAGPASDTFGAVTRPREWPTPRSELDLGSASALGDYGDDADRSELHQLDVTGVGQILTGGQVIGPHETFEAVHFDEICDGRHSARIRGEARAHVARAVVGRGLVAPRAFVARAPAAVAARVYRRYQRPCCYVGPARTWRRIRAVTTPG